MSIELGKFAAHKIRSPVKTHGGKSYLCREIISLFPEHETYLEPFVGGGAVLLNKMPVHEEVASDGDPYLINLWQCLNSSIGSAKLLLSKLESTVYCEETFRDAKTKLDDDNPVVAALACLCVRRMSRGGIGRSFAWSERLRGKRSDTGPIPGELNSWNTLISTYIPQIISRVKHVSFYCCDWKETFSLYDNQKGTLIYLDPPYVQEKRTVKNAYGNQEMELNQHMELLLFLRKCKATWFLSGYHNSLYTKMLKDYPYHEWSMPNHSGQGKTKQRRTEVIWTNYKDVDFKQIEKS